MTTIDRPARMFPKTRRVSRRSFDKFVTMSLKSIRRRRKWERANTPCSTHVSVLIKPRVLATLAAVRHVNKVFSAA